MADRCTGTVNVDDVDHRCKLHHRPGDVNHIADHPVGLLAWPAQLGNIPNDAPPTAATRRALTAFWDACDYAPVFDKGSDGEVPNARQARRDRVMSPEDRTIPRVRRTPLRRCI